MKIPTPDQLRLVFPDWRTYVTVTLRNSATGRMWRHRVDASTAKKVCREAETRWPSVTASVVGEERP